MSQKVYILYLLKQFMKEENQYSLRHEHIYKLLNYRYKDSEFIRNEQCFCGDIRERELTEDDRRKLNLQVDTLVAPWKFRG